MQLIYYAGHTNTAGNECQQGRRIVGYVSWITQHILEVKRFSGKSGDVRRNAIDSGYAFKRHVGCIYVRVI